MPVVSWWTGKEMLRTISLFGQYLSLPPSTDTFASWWTNIYWSPTMIPEKAMAPHSSTLAWKIPWMEEPGRLQSMGLRRVGHDWATSLSLVTFMHWRRKWPPTPVFLPGESQGWWSLVGCRLTMGSHRVEHDWSDLTAAAAAALWSRQWVKLDCTLHFHWWIVLTWISMF